MLKIKNEIAEIIDYTIYFDELSDQEWEYFYSIDDSFMDKYEKAHEEFAEFQDDFAEKWGFSIK